MNDEAYRLEEALLFGRYGIVGYRTDPPDDCPVTAGSTDKSDVDIPQTPVLR